MKKTELYIKSRSNKTLENKNYSLKEINEIVQAQFHYFWYSINLKNVLENCAFSNFNESNLKKVKTQILIFQISNSHIFYKKNEINLFNTVILHLLLNKKDTQTTQINKI